MVAIPDWWIRGPSVRNKNKKKERHKNVFKVDPCAFFASGFDLVRMHDMELKKKKSVQTN